MLDDFISCNDKMRVVFDVIERAAPHDATVLILGESGTGKELIARALHRLSPRNQCACLKVNCATLQRELLVSEMFGHEKGAFTGADRLRIGKFELAHRGTLFLDEIAELDASAQAMLLRVLEEGEFDRLGGGAKPIQVDVRVIAATNQDLWEAVQQGQFREDLYYRLAVLPVTIPPLRERKEDIPLLVWHFMPKFSSKRKTPIAALSLEAEALMRAYDWPGNVRELRNAVHYAAVMAPTGVIQVQDLPQSLHSGPAHNETLNETEVEATRRRVRRAYEENDTVEEIAHILDVHPKYLPRLLDKIGLAYLKRRRGLATASRSCM